MIIVLERLNYVIRSSETLIYEMRNEFFPIINNVDELCKVNFQFD